MNPLRKSVRDPLWREELSIFTGDERYVSRRQFTKFLTLTSLAMFVGNLWILFRAWFYRTPAFPERVVARAGEIPVLGFKIFYYPSAQDPCILVRNSSDSYVAYSRICTHLSCVVFLRPELDCFECPCHNGFFALADGSVLQGPPRRPLPRVLLEQRGRDLVATGVKVS